MQIAVIGAGLAGLSAARALADAGLPPVVFDKSRGLGGRLATRRHDLGPFDHGAPEVVAEDADFAAYLARATGLGAAEARGAAHLGLPGMSGLVRPLAEGLTIRGATPVQSVSGDLDLIGTEGALGRFDQVICAIPVPQTRQVLAPVLADDALNRVEMAPCWTLMAAFDGAATPRMDPAEDMLGAPIAQRGTPGRYVVHARPDWSLAHLEQQPDWVCAQMLAALQARLDLSAPLGAMAHRWRYARTRRALGQPYLSLAGGRILAGGDWALGDSADHAWQSGQAMARAVLAQ